MPDLAVIVRCPEADPRAVETVQSLLAQDTPLEIVVVHRGYPELGMLLASKGMEVTGVEAPAQATDGVVRNLGIAATRAPFIAFIEAGWRARPGWARIRLNLHRAGHDAVASAMVGSTPNSPIGAAYHLARFMRRLPGLPAQRTEHADLSFSRELLNRLGCFAENLPAGEEAHLVARLPRTVNPVWCAGVQTEHDTRMGLIRALFEMYRAGRREAATRMHVESRTRAELLEELQLEATRAHWYAKLGLPDEDWQITRRAMRLYRLMMAARSAGVRYGSPATATADTREAVTA